MKNPIHKSNMRKPLKGILFMLLLSIASSAFISSATQLVISPANCLGKCKLSHGIQGNN